MTWESVELYSIKMLLWDAEQKKNHWHDLLAFYIYIASSNKSQYLFIYLFIFFECNLYILQMIEKNTYLCITKNCFLTEKSVFKSVQLNVWEMIINETPFEVWPRVIDVPKISKTMRQKPSPFIWGCGPQSTTSFPRKFGHNSFTLWCQIARLPFHSKWRQQSSLFHLKSRVLDP